MGEVLLKLNCEVVYEAGEGIEIHLQHEGTLSHDVTRHLAEAGREILLGLQHLAGLGAEPAPEKVRTKIEIVEAGNGEDCI